MLYICLSKYSFVRSTNNNAYIANQCTGKQLVYDMYGAKWLNMLTHIPQDVEEIINKLALCYDNVNKEELKKDFYEFVDILVAEGFVIKGYTISEIRKNDNENIQMQLDIPQITDLTLEVTNHCNEHCIHCYLPESLKSTGTYLNLNKIKKIINEFIQIGGKTITLTGGEIFLYNDLSSLLHFIHEKHLGIIIYSNLISLSIMHLNELRDINILYIQTSLYGVNPNVHDIITGVKGSCARTKQSIEKIVSAKIPLRIVCPVMKENSTEIVNVLEYAKSLNIPIKLELNITAREDQSKENLEHRLSIAEMEILLRKLMAYDKEYTIDMLHRHKHKYDENFSFSEYLNYPVCTAGHYGLYITADGKVTTCPNLQGLEIGHIDSSSIKTIWNNNKVINELRKTTESSFPQCLNCEASDYCFRCFARNYTETGNYMCFPEYACDMAFLAKKIIEE